MKLPGGDMHTGECNYLAHIKIENQQDIHTIIHFPLYLLVGPTIIHNYLAKKPMHLEVFICTISTLYFYSINLQLQKQNMVVV